MHSLTIRKVSRGRSDSRSGRAIIRIPPRQESFVRGGRPPRWRGLTPVVGTRSTGIGSPFRSGLGPIARVPGALARRSETNPTLPEWQLMGRVRCRKPRERTQRARVARQELDETNSFAARADPRASGSSGHSEKLIGLSNPRKALHPLNPASPVQTAGPGSSAACNKPALRLEPAMPTGGALSIRRKTRDPRPEAKDSVWPAGWPRGLGSERAARPEGPRLRVGPGLR